MMSYPEPGVVNHAVVFLASGCESWCVMLSNWLYLTVGYAELIIVNQDEVCIADVYKS